MSKAHSYIKRQRQLTRANGTKYYDDDDDDVDDAAADGTLTKKSWCCWYMNIKCNVIVNLICIYVVSRWVCVYGCVFECKCEFTTVGPFAFCNEQKWKSNINAWRSSIYLAKPINIYQYQYLSKYEYTSALTCMLAYKSGSQIKHN